VVGGRDKRKGKDVHGKILYGMQYFLKSARIDWKLLESAESTGENDEACEEDPSEEPCEDIVQSRDVLEYHVGIF